MTQHRKPTLAVCKFASCDGCQLTLLDCEDQLLDVAERVTIANFPEASSRVLPGPYDVTLVEGSVTTPHDRDRLLSVRKQTRVLVTIGACATAGGVQALRNAARVDEYRSLVYAHPEYVDTLETSTPIAAHVKVDYELRGCPIDKHQLLAVLRDLLAGRRPRLPQHSVCLDCKIAGHVCVLVAHGTPCLGPVTHSGCGSLCPRFTRGCYGCFGPLPRANTVSLESALRQTGARPRDVARLYSTFNAAAPEFEAAAQDAHAPGPAAPMTLGRGGSQGTDEESKP